MIFLAFYRQSSSKIPNAPDISSFPAKDIENNVVRSPIDFNQLSNKFMVLKQDAQEIADA